MGGGLIKRGKIGLPPSLVAVASDRPVLQVVLGLLESDLICAWFIYGKTQATRSPRGSSHSLERIFRVSRGLLI